MVSNRRVAGSGRPVAVAAASKLLPLFVVTFNLVCGSPLVYSDSRVLSEQMVLESFYQTNVGLLLAHYAVDVAKAQAIIATEIQNPQLNIDVYQLTTRHKDSDAARSARIDQLVELGGKRHLRRQSAQLGTEAALADLRDAVRTLSNAVRRAYYNLVLTRKALALANEELDHLREIARLNALRFKRGDISESDLLRVEVEMLKTESERNLTLVDLQKARSDLALLLAWPADAGTLEVEEVWPVSFPSAVDQDGSDVTQLALANRPDLAAARLRSEQARRDYNLARKLRVPDVTVGVDFTHDATLPRPVNDTVGIGLSVAIPLFNHYDGEIGRAAANINTVDAQAQQTEQAVRADVQNAVATWHGINDVVHSYEGGILDRVRMIRDAAELAYSKGATTVLDLIDAQRQFKQIMHEYYTALDNRVIAYYDLVAAVGKESEP